MNASSLRNETTTSLMISPASGIHRPSYNGAPARQAYNFDQIVLVAGSV